MTRNEHGGLNAYGKKGSPDKPEKAVRAVKFSPFSSLTRLHMLGLKEVRGDLRIEPERVGQYDYQNVNTAVLGELLATVYQRHLEQLLSDKIWQPAGAATAYWRRYGEDKPVSPYCCIYATARDWLRVGRFLSANGTRNMRFLPKDLWRQYFGSDLKKEQLAGSHYGLHIYHNVLDRKGEPLQGRFTFLFGNRGQTIYLMPDKDLVVVRLGERIPLLHSTLYSAWRSIKTE